MPLYPGPPWLFAPVPGLSSPEAAKSASFWALFDPLPSESFWLNIHSAVLLAGLSDAAWLGLSFLAAYFLLPYVTTSPLWYSVPDCHAPLNGPLSDSSYVPVGCVPMLHTETVPATPTK